MTVVSRVDYQKDNRNFGEWAVIFLLLFAIDKQCRKRDKYHCKSK